MEKTYKVTTEEKDITAGFFVECECFVCGNKQMFGAETKEEMVEEMKSEGWVNLHSDTFGAIGFYDGCVYDKEQ